MQGVAGGGFREGFPGGGLRTAQGPPCHRPAGLPRQMGDGRPRGGELLQGEGARGVVRPEPGHRLFENPPGLVGEARIPVRPSPVDQQGAQVDGGHLGSPPVAPCHGHRLPQQHDRLVGGGGVAHGLVPAAQRFGEVVQVQGPLHRRRRAVVQRAAQHRHGLGQPDPVAGDQTAVHEGAAQVGERHPDPHPGGPGHGLAQRGDGLVPERLVPAPDGPAPPEEAEAGEEDAAQAVRHRPRRGQGGPVVALGLVGLPRLAPVAVERPQAVGEAEQGAGRGRARRHGDRLPVVAHGLLQRCGVGGEAGEVAQRVAERRTAVGAAVGGGVRRGHGPAQHRDALLQRFRVRTELGARQQGLAEPQEEVDGEVVPRLGPGDGLPVGGHRLGQQPDPAGVRHDAHQAETDVRAAYGALGAGERRPPHLLAEEAHRFLVQAGVARLLRPLHKGFGVLGVAVPVLRAPGPEPVQPPAHLRRARAPPLRVRPGAPDQRRPEVEARAGREVLAGRGQGQARAEAADGLVGVLRVAGEQQAAAERPQDPGLLGGVRGDLRGELPEQGGRGVGRTGVGRTPEVSGVPGGTLVQQLREEGGEQDPACHVVGGPGPRPPTGVGDGLVQVVRGVPGRVPGVQRPGEREVGLGAHRVAGRSGVEGLAARRARLVEEIGAAGVAGESGQQQREVGEVRGALEGVRGGVRGPPADGDALLGERGAPRARRGFREEGDPQVGEERGGAGHDGARPREGRTQQGDALGAQPGVVQAVGGEAERGAQGGAVVGAVRAVLRGEFHRLPQREDRLVERFRLPGRIGQVAQGVAEVTVSAGLFVPVAGGAGHGGAPGGDGVGERLPPGAVLVSVEEGEPQVRQADALLKAAGTGGVGGVPQQRLRAVQDAGVAALLEHRHHPDAGVVRHGGPGRGAVRFARHQGEDRAHPERHPVGVLFADRGEPEQGRGEGGAVGRTAHGVAEEVGRNRAPERPGPRRSRPEGRCRRAPRRPPARPPARRTTPGRWGRRPPVRPAAGCGPPPPRPYVPVSSPPPSAPATALPARPRAGFPRGAHR